MTIPLYEESVYIDTYRLSIQLQQACYLKIYTSCSTKINHCHLQINSLLPMRRETDARDRFATSQNQLTAT